jgi:hypothetical protein
MLWHSSTRSEIANNASLKLEGPEHEHEILRRLGGPAPFVTGWNILVERRL